MSVKRKIIHCDADCFYAAIEVRDDPSLIGRPVAIGGEADRRGVIATCNYEARGFGVHSAMATAYARRLCPGLILIKPSFDKYRQASSKIREIFHRYTDLVEPLSLDEAFLDVTDCKAFGGCSVKIAEAIRAEVEAELNITVSAGVATNKFLAKVASDWKKPDGLTVITDADVDSFVANLSVKRIFGVGKVTAQKMAALGITTCEDLQKYQRDQLSEMFGSFGARLHQLCRGIDHRPVSTARRRKSLSVEQTFDSDLPDLAACHAQLPQLLAKMMGRLEALDDSYVVHKPYLKLKFCDFTATTVEKAGSSPVLEDFRDLCSEAFSRELKPVRLLGVGVRFVGEEEPEQEQIALF